MNYTHGSEEPRRRIHGAGGRIDESLRGRVDRARNIVENVRDRAELAFRDRPYLVPVAAGAVGLGIGILLGSKLTRFLVFTAVGTLVSETFGGEIRRVSREFLSEVQRRVAEGHEDGPHEESR